MSAPLTFRRATHMSAETCTCRLLSYEYRALTAREATFLNACGR
jgi:hypothetical protein